MNCHCQICQKTIEADFVPAVPDDPTNPIREYDRLAENMRTHITNEHPFQVDEMIRIANHASKMYSMNWAGFDVMQGQRLDELRKQWRAQLIMMMATTTLVRQTPAPSAGGVSSPRPIPEGSN